jgi:hypothetical protein
MKKQTDRRNHPKEETTLAEVPVAPPPEELKIIRSHWLRFRRCSSWHISSEGKGKG